MAPTDTNDDEDRAQEGSADPASPVESGAAGEQPPDPLSACREEVQELKAENAELRESAESFGALAERLNRAKRSEP
jgi:hypothetical protein